MQNGDMRHGGAGGDRRRESVCGWRVVVVKVKGEMRDEEEEVPMSRGGGGVVIECAG